MLKLKQNHTSRDVKVLTDQLVDAVASVGIVALSKGAVTLAVSATSTTVTDQKVTPQSLIFFTPTSATAQGLTHYVAAAGQFTIFHSASSVSDRSYGYVLF